MFSLRKAELQDVPRVVAFAHRAYADTFTHYDSNDLAAFLTEHYGQAEFSAAISNPTHEFWLAEEDGEIIAYAELSPYKLPVLLGSERSLELRQLYVAANRHGQGIGTALFLKMEAMARARGADAIYLGVWSKNFKAQGFYTRYGFTKVAEYDYPPIGTIVDREWIMMKSLKN